MPTYLRLADGRHRLYFFAYGRQGKQSVQRYLAADSDDGRRIAFRPDRPCLYSVWDNTKDKKFLPGQKLEDILTNDVATVYQLPDGSFEMFVQSLEKIGTDDPRYVAHDNLKGWVRSIDRFTSDDGVRFDKRQRKVLAPDGNDPVDTQFYHLAVTHTGAGRVGCWVGTELATVPWNCNTHSPETDSTGVGRGARGLSAAKQAKRIR